MNGLPDQVGQPDALVVLVLLANAHEAHRPERPQVALGGQLHVGVLRR